MVWLFRAATATTLAVLLCAVTATAETGSRPATAPGDQQALEPDTADIAEKAWSALEYDSAAQRNWATDQKAVRMHFARTPDEATRMFREQYGPDSILTRSVSAVAVITNAAERSAQLPLDSINSVTEKVSGVAQEMAGIGRLPTIKLKSKVDSHHFGVSLTTKW
ncbi:MAG TPA: hypothetical protein EYG16_05285 [Deltaproteobacteria bacterium]|nr:hypothetical protein [Candidatus Binatota bacterium]HIL13068.1 hypothetical protein [Deltaproteobacteria bacterium]